MLFRHFSRTAATLAVFLFSGLGLAAQNTGFVIRGTIVDSQTSEPEPGAAVQLFEHDTEPGSMKAYALSDSLGVFTITCRQLEAEQEYVLLVVNMGRKTERRSFRPSGPVTDVGAISLSDDVQTIGSSRVTAAKPLVRMEADKISYDIQGDADSKASTVLDMLRKVPMVTVDGQDNITVNGSSSFKVYVDGKPNQMLSSNPSKIFKVMPSSAFKSIEVITNPGAKYDAEGTGGVLNLITGQGQGASSAVPDGANGSVSLGTDTRGGVNGGLYLNAKKGRLTVGGNIYAGIQRNRDISQYSSQNLSDGSVITTGMNNANQRNPYLFGDLSAGFEIDTLNLLSASLGLRGWSYRQVADGFIEMTGNNVWGSDGSASATGISTATGGSRGMDASLDWQHCSASDKERIFTLSYRFSGDPETEFSETRYDKVTGISLPDRKVKGNDVSQEHTIQADYTTPIFKGQTLSAGGKYIYRDNHSMNSYFLDNGSGYLPVETGNDEHRHYDHIAAAYSEYAGTFGSFSAKAGLRYEYTWVDVRYDDGRSYGTGYGNLVPSISLQYNTGAASNLALTYNMRIRRPGIGYLNPFIDRSSTASISYGNPDISPERTHDVAAKFNFFTPKVMLNAGVNYRFGEGGIAAYEKYAPDPDDESVMIMHSTYGNIVDTRDLGFNWFINWNPVKDTRIYSSGRTGYTFIDSAVLGQENKGWTGNIMIGAQQTIPWDLRLSANLFANTRRYSLQGWNSGFSGAVLGISRGFFENKLNVTLRGFTHLTGGSKASFKSYSKGDGFTTEGKFALPIRSIGIELTYNFGKNQVQVKKARRTISNDDVVNAEKSVRQQSSQASMQ